MKIEGFAPDALSEHTHIYNFSASRYSLVFSEISCIGIRLSKQAIRSAPCSFKSLLLVFPVHCFHLCHKICTDRAIVVLCGQLLCMCDKEAGKVMTLSRLAEDAQVLRFTPYAHLTDSRVSSKATKSTKVAEQERAVGGTEGSSLRPAGPPNTL